ncbi:MAG: phenylalanine--tRNA ligase subunit alpha [Pseudomonadota bacterium]
MLNKVDDIRSQALAELNGVADVNTAQGLKNKYLSRKGIVPALLNEMRNVPAEHRPEFGKRVNELKDVLLHNINLRLEEFAQKSCQDSISKDRVDVTLPGRGVVPGYDHPIRQTTSLITQIFTDMGFSVFEGPEIESDYYNFEALNFPTDHPARDMQDTFYVEGGRVLRTHTSPVQIRVMEKNKPPIAMIAPGAVYRSDSDVSHSPMFYQVEGLLVDENITMGDLKGVLSVFCRRIFGEKLKVRFRPSFFPFTEPSAEVDISCVMCKGKGCRICKDSGWLEILGCGMVDPKVYEFVNYDSSKVSGFAFGMGVDRIAMLLYGINDIRLFYENDLRFLEQF